MYKSLLIEIKEPFNKEFSGLGTAANLYLKRIDTKEVLYLYLNRNTEL